MQEAVHKTNGKRVSVWSFDKKNSSLDRLTPNAKDCVFEVLKAEVGTDQMVLCHRAVCMCAALYVSDA